MDQDQDQDQDKNEGEGDDSEDDNHLAPVLFRCTIVLEAVRLLSVYFSIQTGISFILMPSPCRFLVVAIRLFIVAAVCKAFFKLAAQSPITRRVVPVATPAPCINA